MPVVNDPRISLWDLPEHKPEYFTYERDKIFVKMLLDHTFVNQR